MKTKIPLLILTGLFGTATAQAEVLYQSDFTGTTLSSAGLVKSAGAAGGSWGINTAGDFLDGLGSGNARSNVTTIDSFALADGYKGFQLDTTFRTTSGMTRHSFGLVDANYTISGSNDWLNSSLAGAYGIGFSTAGSTGGLGGGNYLGFNNDAGTVTGLSTAQGNATVGTAWQSMSMIVTDESWSYSLNNATATTGSHTFDTSRSYDFTAHAQRNPYADFQNISVTAIRPEWEGGTGNWDTGFTHGASETHTIAFSGAGGTATNNIADTTLTNVHDIEFMSGAGAYTLEANAATAGASGGTALTVNGSIINNSANLQTINTALDFAATRTVEANTADITIGGLISGAGGLTKEGASTLTLSGANTYTGATTLNDGTITVANNSALGTGTLTLNGGTFTQSSGVEISNDIVISGTTTVLPSSNSFTLSGNISGAGTLITGSQSGNKYLTIIKDLSGFTGKIIHNNSGNLLLFSGTGSVNTTAAIETQGSTTGGQYLRLQKHATFGELSGTGGRIGSNRNLTIDQSTDTTYSGYMFKSQSGTFNFIKAGIGTLTLNGTSKHTYNGATTVSGGTLQLGDGGSDGAISGSGISVGSGATFAVNQNDTVTQGTDFSGAAISGAGGFTQSGTGTTTLNAANTYTGATTIDAGTLIIDGDQSGATGAMTINVSGALGGSGTIGASLLTVNGVIAPGNSPGTLATGSQLWNDGGSYLWEINASNDAGGTIGTDPGWDWLDITGTLDLSLLSAGGFTIDIDSLTSGNIAGDAVGFDTWTKGNPGDVDYSFTIATASGGITDFSADKFSFDSSGFTNGPSWDWQIKLSGTDLVLEAYAVPEPSSTALLGLGGLALMLRRKRS